MKKEILTIRHKDIMQRLFLHSYYRGEAHKTAGMPKHFSAGIQASESDSDMLENHILTAITECVKLLSRYFAVCSVKKIDENESRITELHLQPPCNFPRESLSQMEQCIGNYIVMRTLQQWLAQHKPDDSLLAAEEVKSSTIDIRETASLRKRPCRTAHKSNKSIEL